MSRLPGIIVAIVCGLLYASTAQAVADDSFNPKLTYNCDRENDRVVVTNSLLKGGDAASFRYSDADGTYNPWDLVTIDSASSRPRIIERSRLVKQCELSSGVYTITLEPHTFGSYLDGRCGAMISSAITVSLDGIDILEKTSFEAYCHGNSPVIVKVTTHGASAEVEIKRMPKHRFY